MTKPNYQDTQTNVKEEEKKGTKSLNRKRLPLTTLNSLPHHYPLPTTQKPNSTPP